MALRRTGVMFKVKNPGKLVMTGKLQLTAEMMKEWSKYQQQHYKERVYIEVEIGMFKNEKGDVQYYPLLEFLPDGKEDGQQQGNEVSESDDLPF
jgi:hypothetical protein